MGAIAHWVGFAGVSFLEFLRVPESAKSNFGLQRQEEQLSNAGCSPNNKNNNNENNNNNNNSQN